MRWDCCASWLLQGDRARTLFPGVQLFRRCSLRLLLVGLPDQAQTEANRICNFEDPALRVQARILRRGHSLESGRKKAMSPRQVAAAQRTGTQQNSVFRDTVLEPTPNLARTWRPNRERLPQFRIQQDHQMMRTSSARLASSCLTRVQTTHEIVTVTCCISIFYAIGWR